MNGLGMWKPASMPQSVFINISPLLNLKYFMLTLGYLTFLFETIFIFTFWRKSWRVFLLTIGICLHIGILICFPIPFFALGVSTIYLLMVPVKIWKVIFDSKIIKLLSRKLRSYLVFLIGSFKSITSLHSETTPKYNSINTFRKHKIYLRLSFFGLLIITLIQLIVSFNSPL